MTAAAAPRPRRRVPPAVMAAIADAWALAIGAQAVGAGGGLHHDALIEGPLPHWASLALFMLAWQVMIAAMMLPSSLPLIRGARHRGEDRGC